MKKLFLLISVCLLSLFLVGCNRGNSDDVGSDGMLSSTISTVESTTEDIVSDITEPASDIASGIESDVSSGTNDSSK